MIKKNFLIEIGTEELPSNLLRKTSECFLKNFSDELKIKKFKYEKITWFATPRRIALKIKNLHIHPLNDEVKKYNIPFNTIFDENKQLTDFGKKLKNKYNINKYKKVIINNKIYLSYILYKKSFDIENLFSIIIKRALLKISFSKFMQWDNIKEKRFIRPIRNIVVLLDDIFLLIKIFDIVSSSIIFGHRFMGEQKIFIKNADQYPNILLNKGFVIADYNIRKEKIRSEIIKISKKIGGKVYISDNLLEEVTSLVEYPVALLGKFNKKFLKLPIEILILTMEKNQKYFPIYNNKNILIPYFIFISNIKSKITNHIISGNEQVINSRFSDLEYFFNLDIKNKLENYLLKLKNVIFQKKLGTMYEKTYRVQKLSNWIAKKINANNYYVTRGALLAKCDLMTNMVCEIPDVKGIIGMYYAKISGENIEVCKIIKEQYIPLKFDDNLPSSLESCALAIADKLDTLTGIIGIGKIAKGKKDPFGLRRLSLGVLRIIIEKNLFINLEHLIAISVRLYSKNINYPRKIIFYIIEFIQNRLKIWYQKIGYHDFIINSVINITKLKNLKNFKTRIASIKHFYKNSDFIKLIAINKRICNILSKIVDSKKLVNKNIDISLLQNKEEIDLINFMDIIFNKSFYLLENGLYKEMWIELFPLSLYVNNFFDKVFINVSNEKIKNNRIVILLKLKNLLLKIANLSYLK